MANKIVVGNLKMNMTIDEISNYLRIINKEVYSKRVIICPTSIYIPYFLKQRYLVGLQNIFMKDAGSFTGEISPKQASSIGIECAIIGHSERKLYFNENDILINNKIKDAIKYNLHPIVCVGETNEEKELLKTDRVLKRQIMNYFRGLSKDELDNIIIAYEPIWAIGTNIVPKNSEIEATINYIKDIFIKLFDYPNVKVLYGGSINEKNIKTLNKINNISGFLVGNASTKPDKFLKIIEVVVNQ